ncbi:MAG TPA: pilus assembly protein TadG-related protein [Glaciihabitans sp.]|jgi:uncharacterized membrane protein|nr:pilus assembly protein TadG-related protein [Glaciihabitans sp.]
MTRALRVLAREERGTTLVLTVFYLFLAVGVILAVVAATSLYLERKRLFSLADSAALVGAEAFTLNDVGLTENGPRATLHSDAIRSAVQGYLDQNPSASLENVVLERADTADGRSATVALSAYWHPPMVTVFLPDGLRLDVTVVARSVFTG